MGEILAKIHQSDINDLGELKEMSFDKSLKELYKVYSSRASTSF